MHNVINFTPYIDEEILTKIIFEIEEFKFYYQYNSLNNRKLDTKYPDNSFVDNIIFFDDPMNEWDPENFNLQIHTKISINNPTFMFQPLGPVKNDNDIGIAVIWSCKSVSLRGVKRLGTIKADAKNATFDLELDFPKGTLKKEINLSVITYLMGPKSYGTTIGELTNQSIVIEGNGSVFPIVEIREKGLPLWWVDINWGDPQEDEFDEEYLKLCINRDHANYKKLFSKGMISDKQLFNEIMGATLQIIIEKVMHSQYWNDIINNYNNKPGSIAEAVYYFISTFNWDYSSPELLSRSIRMYLEDNM